MGLKTLRVAVIIPAYRASDTIEKVLGGIPGWVDAVYVVDYASADETAARVHAPGDPRVRLLAHDVNQNVRECVRAWQDSRDAGKIAHGDRRAESADPAREVRVGQDFSESLYA